MRRSPARWPDLSGSSRDSVAIARKRDIGAPVKAGQLLAEIEAPDLYQQLVHAKAALASAGKAPTAKPASAGEPKPAIGQIGQGAGSFNGAGAGFYWHTVGLFY